MHYSNRRSGIVIWGYLLTICLAVTIYPQALPAETKGQRPPASSVTNPNDRNKQADATKSLSGKNGELRSETNAKAAEVSETATANKITVEEKEQILRSILTDVTASAFQIEPVEYGILAQVEAATLLWEKDRGRATDELSKATARLRELMLNKSESRSIELFNKLSAVEKKRFRLAIMRKIARLDPELIRDLMAEKINEDNSKAKPSVIAEATDEGSAVMSVALGEMKRDPKYAAQLAQQSLSFGVTGAINIFLTMLAREDKQLAEEQTVLFLSKIRESSVTPIMILNLRHLLPPQMTEYYLESLAIRLRRNVSPNLTQNAYNESLIAAKAGIRDAAAYPGWRDEFVRLASEFEALMANRSQPIPVPQSKTISMSGMIPASPGNTGDIENSAAKLEPFPNSKLKDAEYQKLAIEAAEKADIDLAEKLLAKMSDEDVRRQTSVRVYSPLVKKAINENDWPQARRLALKISDPLGQSLIVTTVAKAMSGGKVAKPVIKDFYDSALSNLDRETPSLLVAKGMIYLAQSRFGSEPEEGFNAVQLAISVLNKVDLSEPYAKKSGLTNKGLTPWVNQTNLMLDVNDYFDLTETIGPLFKTMSGKNFIKAQELAQNFLPQSLKLLAQLGIASNIQEELRQSKPLQKAKPTTSAH